MIIVLLFVQFSSTIVTCLLKSTKLDFQKNFIKIWRYYFLKGNFLLIKCHFMNELWGMGLYYKYFLDLYVCLYLLRLYWVIEYESKSSHCSVVCSPIVDHWESLQIQDLMDAAQILQHPHFLLSFGSLSPTKLLTRGDLLEWAPNPTNMQIHIHSCCCVDYNI